MLHGAPVCVHCSANGAERVDFLTMVSMCSSSSWLTRTTGQNLSNRQNLSSVCGNILFSNFRSHCFYLINGCTLLRIRLWLNVSKGVQSLCMCEEGCLWHDLQEKYEEHQIITFFEGEELFSLQNTVKPALVYHFEPFAPAPVMCCSHSLCNISLFCSLFYMKVGGTEDGDHFTAKRARARWASISHVKDRLSEVI